MFKKKKGNRTNYGTLPTPISVLDPLYLTSHRDPITFQYFSNGETEAERLNYLPKASQLSRQHSRGSNTNSNNYSKPQLSFELRGREKGRKEKNM